MRPPRTILQLMINRSPKLHILTVSVNIKYILEALYKNSGFMLIDSINIYLYHVAITVLGAGIQRRINIWSLPSAGAREIKHIMRQYNRNISIISV